MSYSRRQLYAMGEPLGDGATRREVGGKVIYGGGGGGGTPETQRQIVDLPEWAKPYAKESLGKAQALSESPYQAYGGERIAQFSPLQKQAFGRAEGQQVAGQIGFGSGLAGLAGTSSFGDQGTAAGFMSPYMQQVVDNQMSSAQRQADIAATQRGAAAVRAGAFGGSRQAVENAEAARALASQKGDIQAKGLQSAFEQAQNQFNQEQSQRLNAAQALGQLGQQQFGQQMDITGQQAQFGQQQRAATQDVLSAQYQDFLNQQRAPYDQLAFMTSMIRGTPMGQTTTMYQPGPSTASQMVGLGTAAAGAYGAAQGRAAGGEVHSYAAGGIASLNQPELAAMAGGMSDQQLGQTAQMPSITELAKMTLAAEAQQRAQMRQQATAQKAGMQEQPQTTVAEDQMASIGGLSGLPAPNLEGMEETAMAGGGIIAFDQGGTIRLPKGTPPDEVETIRMQNPDQTVVVEGQADLYRDTIRPFFTGYSDSARALGRPDLVEGLSQRGTTAGAARATPTSSSPAANRTALNAANQAADKAEKAAEPKPSPAPKVKKEGAAPAGLSTLRPSKDFFAKPRADIEALGLEEKALAEQDAEAVRKDQEELGQRGSERKKRIEEGMAGLEGKKDQNFNMALIEAGLAMMAGNSANAFENIGKGALVGTKAFTEGTERLNREKARLEDSLAVLEDLQFSDAKTDKAELRKAQSAVKQAEIGTKKALANLGIKEAEVVVDLFKSDRENASRERIAGMAAARTERPFNYRDSYAEYLKSFAGKTTIEPPMTYEQYVRQFALPVVGGTTNQLPQGATVLPR